MNKSLETELIETILSIIESNDEYIEIPCKCGDGYVSNIFNTGYEKCPKCRGGKRQVSKLDAIKFYIEFYKKYIKF